MGQGITFSVSDEVSPRLASFLRGLSDLSGVHEALALEGQLVVRDHLIGLASTRHATAARLGATPTNHLGQAAEKVTAASDAEVATISVNHPGMGRAAHDVDIKPGPGKKALTLPLIAAAYGQRAKAVDGLFPVTTKKGGAYLAKTLPDGGLQFWYKLVPSVHQEQDRTLLPSDEALGLAGVAGVRNYVEFLLSQSGDNSGGAQ